MAISEKLTPTAPEALVLNWLTKKVSAILYMEVISMLIIVGTASLGIRRLIGVSIIILCFSS